MKLYDFRLKTIKLQPKVIKLQPKAINYPRRMGSFIHGKADILPLVRAPFSLRRAVTAPCNGQKKGETLLAY